MSAPPVTLGTLFWIFFRIACISFGGFMAMISVVQNVVVERKKLMRHEEMLDGISRSLRCCPGRWPSTWSCTWATACAALRAPW